MDINRIIDEMQFITNTITDDVDYLLYLMLKDGRNSKEIEVSDIEEKDDGYFKENSLEDWFNSL